MELSKIKSNMTGFLATRLDLATSNEDTGGRSLNADYAVVVHNNVDKWEELNISFVFQRHQILLTLFESVLP